MSTYFPTKIQYISEEIKLGKFDLHSQLEELKDKLQDNKNPFYWEKLQELQVQFHIITPDFKIVEKFYNLGKIKSHEVVAISEKIKEQVKSAIIIMVNTIEHTINQYLQFKHTISIGHTESFQKKKGPKSERTDTINFVFKTTRLTINDCFSFLKWSNLAEFAFSKQIRLEVKGKYEEETNFIPILDVNLEKISLDPSKDFLSLGDKTNELLGHRNYFKILKAWMFPEKFESQAEITLDIAKSDRFPQKRRTVSIDNSKMKFHQIITKATPLKEYQKIIRENQIAGLYCSVKSANDNLIYLLIDIDVPSILYSLFPVQKIWTLTLNIAKSITKTASRFGLPKFKISFSGAKGIHMVLALTNSEVIMDTEQYVNFPELYNFANLPGIGTLKKEKISTLNDKFKFTKSLLQSLLLFTIYKGNIEIPEEIRYKLKINHPYQLFRLSPDSKNRLSILLDCSSMSRGVFRLFSPHPATKLVSIPLSSGTEFLNDRYLDYNNVCEDAKIENVIERFHADDIGLFLQTPNKVTRTHFKTLLRPDKLTPSLATLLRFGTIYSVKRYSSLKLVD